MALSTAIVEQPPVNSAVMAGLAYTPSIRSFADSLLIELSTFRLPATSIDDPYGLEPPRTQTAIQDRPPQNPFARLAASELSKVKPLMLTLHCLFPNDLLPALDILDRGLVRRLVQANDGDTVPTAPGHGQSVAGEDQRTSQESGSRTEIASQNEDIFLVTSASAVPPNPAGPSSISEHEKGYEVRLHAWNCTCPTFALSAFRDLAARLNASAEQHHSHAEQLHDRAPVVYPFGGTLTRDTDRDSPPICKHILACVLFARCPGLFGDDGDGKCVVSMEELAGWCAGWGG